MLTAVLTTRERRGPLQGDSCNSHSQVAEVNATLAECISNAEQHTHRSRKSRRAR